MADQLELLLGVPCCGDDYQRDGGRGVAKIRGGGRKEYQLELLREFRAVKAATDEAVQVGGGVGRKEQRYGHLRSVYILRKVSAQVSTVI